MTLNPDLALDRAIDDFRRGRPVLLVDGAVRLAALALDLASDDSLAAFEQTLVAPARLLITARRAEILKITNDRAAAGASAVLLERDSWADLSYLVATADPVRDLAFPLKGPYRPQALGGEARAAEAALALAKAARLLPAALIGIPKEPPADWLTVEAETILSRDQRRAQNLHIVAEAKVPLRLAEHARLIAFRADDGGLEHIAILIGDPPRQEPVLTRLHSECFTGDLLGSLKCDCGPQLQGALAALTQAGGGVLLYLAQEGRGIGLVNKLRAYALQDQGFDTVDANLRLGFEIDERDFWPAARMLTLLGFSKVRLLTNNPEKVSGLEACGIKVVERVAHQFPANPHNADYLATKRHRTGHFL